MKDILWTKLVRLMEDFINKYEEYIAIRDIKRNENVFTDDIFEGQFPHTNGDSGLTKCLTITMINIITIKWFGFKGNVEKQ